jgi:hypothetical protein
VAEPVRPGAPLRRSTGGEERWGRLYALLLGALALEIAGLWVLERVFR